MVKENTVFIAGRQPKRTSNLCLKDLNAPVALRQEVLKAAVGGEGHSVHDQVMHIFLSGWWESHRVMFWES